MKAHNNFQQHIIMHAHEPPYVGTQNINTKTDTSQRDHNWSKTIQNRLLYVIRRMYEFAYSLKQKH
jgi:hypothetical protein